MSKRKVIIAVVMALVLLAVIVCVCLFLFGGQDHSQIVKDDHTTEGELTYNDNWLTFDFVEELEIFVKQRELSIQYDMDNAYVSDLYFADGLTTYCYDIGENGKITGLNVGYILVDSVQSGETFTMEEITGPELFDRVDSVMDWVSIMLNVEVENEFYIIATDGNLLPVEEADSYQQIIEGHAFLELRILDTDDSVWVLTVEKIEGYNIISCVFRHCPADSNDAKIPCNIAIKA